MMVIREKEYFLVNMRKEVTTEDPLKYERIFRAEFSKDQSIKHAIVNMDDVRYINSSAITVLKRFMDALKNMGINVYMMNLQPEVQKIMRMIRFDLLYPMIESEGTLIKRLKRDEVSTILDLESD